MKPCVRIREPSKFPIDRVKLLLSTNASFVIYLSDIRNLIVLFSSYIIYLVFNSWLYQTWFKRLAGYGSSGQGKILFLSAILRRFREGCCWCQYTLYILHWSLILKAPPTYREPPFAFILLITMKSIKSSNPNACFFWILRWYLKWQQYLPSVLFSSCISLYLPLVTQHYECIRSIGLNRIQITLTLYGDKVRARKIEWNSHRIKTTNSGWSKWSDHWCWFWFFSLSSGTRD